MLLTAKGKTYAPTGIDRLWLLRAVQAEGEPRAQVAATLVNGFMWASTRGFQGVLTDWIRAYAQPVNPRHFPQGDLFRDAHAKASPAKRIDLAKLADKRERIHSTRVSFDRETEAAVDLALTTPPTMPNATDYAEAAHDASRKGYIPLTEPKKNENRFWVRPAAVDWAGYQVLAAGGPTVSLILFGLVVWALARA